MGERAAETKDKRQSEIEEEEEEKSDYAFVETDNAAGDY